MPAATLGESRSETDQDGMTTIPTSTSKLTWTAEIRAAGFQTEIFDLKLQPDEIRSVELKPSRPTTVRITSGADGKLVPGVFAFATADHGNSGVRATNRFLRDPREEKTEDYESKFAGLYRYGPSNSEGVLTLDSLADDTTYDFLIMAPGFGPTFLKAIEAGTPLIDLTIHPGLSVSGQIVGDLSGLRTRGGSTRKHIRYRNVDRNAILYADVEEQNGKGYFDIKHLARGDFWLQFPDRTIAYALTQSINDLVIDLNTPGRHDHRRPSQAKLEVSPDRTLKAPTRKVILKLRGADPTISLNGQILAGFIPRERPGAYTSANYEIKNRQVEFDVEVPTKILWAGKGFTGYSVVKKSEVDVGVSDDPFRADVQLLPAGAVRGEVRLADGSLARRFQTYVIPVERIDGFNNKEVRIDGSDAPGEFLLTGLPLGHEYQTLVIDERPKSVTSVLSEPFRIDEGQPIVDLKFQFNEGREHVIQLVDEAGNSAVGARAGGWSYPTKRFGRSGGYHADEHGKIILKHIPDKLPGRVELHVKHAGGFVGQILKLDVKHIPETVTLSRGVSASGRLIDLETGRGIANVRFYIYPSPWKASSSKQNIFASADEQGNFSFDSLEAINYQLSLYGGVPPRVPLVKNRLGVVEPDYSNISDGTNPEWFIEGGRDEPYIIKVKMVPKRGLKLAPQ
jgi:hypothetical protein